MQKKLRILHLEDDPNDAELVKSTLVAEGIDCDVLCVSTRTDFIDALEKDAFDLILADYSLPQFDGLSALTITQEKCPDVPFILVSGAIGEESAIEILKKGATDYVLKDRLSRLVPAVRRALREAKEQADRKQAEGDLWKSKESYRALVDNTVLGIAVMDTNYRIIMVNSTFAELFKKSASDFVGKYCFREFEKREAVCQHCPGTRAMVSGKTEEVETQGVRDDGSHFYVHNRAVPFFEQDGTLGGFIEMVEDIDVRKKAEKTLRENEKKYKTLIENLPQKIFLKDKNLIYVSCNENYARDLKINSDEITGRTDYDFYPNELAEKYRADDKKIMDSGRTEDFEEKYMQDGQERFVQTVKTSVKDQKGNIVGILGIFWDITERKRLEDMLLQSQEDMKMLNESLEIVNTALDKERNELRFALDEISLYIQQVVDKKDLSVRYSNPNLKRCYEIMQCAKKECPCHGKENLRCWQISGTYCSGKEEEALTDKFGNCVECPVFKEATSDPVYQIGEHFNNMMHIIDLKNRELENAYTQLKAAQSQILQQEKMASIGQLAAGIAHEINNPIGFISSNLGTLDKYVIRLGEFINAQSEVVEALNVKEALEELKEKRKKLKLDYITQDIKELIKESLEGAGRVKKIVQDLKSFSRVDEADYKHADINECLESTINIVWNELKYKVTLKKEYGDLPLTKCYPQQLNQVFMNLLVNAAHAIEKQGEITVKTLHEDNHISISISDTGCGISDENLNRIFEPFFTTKKVGKGTGLGLSITYDIVKKHNGEITVQSEVGKGTTFNVLIPVVEGR